jgi:GntR family transcriptional regulator
MLFQIDPSNGIPIFLQIVNQVKYKVATGAAQEGDRLPSVRELASTLRINPNTVAKAYGELERDGVIKTKRGLGCYIANKDVVIKKDERIKMLTKHIDRTLTEAFHLDIPLNEVETIFQKRLNQMRERSES